MLCQLTKHTIIPKACKHFWMSSWQFQMLNYFSVLVPFKVVGVGGAVAL